MGKINTFLLSWHFIPSFYFFAEASPQQGFIAETFIRSSYRSRIQRCSANRGRYFQLVFSGSSIHCRTLDSNIFSGLPNRMAGCNGNCFTVHIHAIFCWIFLCWSTSAPAYSCGFWSPHYVDQPGCLLDPRHQSKCMGTWI